MNLSAHGGNLITLYRKRARFYDLEARLYYLIGFRYSGYREYAVAALALRQGDTVVEIGCGTGANFALLRRLVGPTGKIIGVDLSDAMLARARHRIESESWSNVELVRCDATQYAFPPGVNGVLSTYALTLLPQYERVIESGAKALAPCGRWVLLDFKAPAGWPHWAVKLGVRFIAPFGATLDMAQRHPWETMKRCLENVTLREFYFGTTYVAVGESPLRECG